MIDGKAGAALAFTLNAILTLLFLGSLAVGAYAFASLFWAGRG